MSRLFISHSSKDNIAAIAFKQWLGARGWANEDVFLDVDSIGAGERWKEALNKANTRCEAIVLLASPEALSSPECIAEVRKAEDVGKEIVVVLLRDLQVEDNRLGAFKDRQIVDLAAPPQSHVEIFDYRGEHHEVRFNAPGLARVQDFLEKRGITPDRFAWPPPNKPNAEPFPGLSAFTEDDAGIFFGRDADIVRGLDRLRIVAAQRPAPFAGNPGGIGRWQVVLSARRAVAAANSRRRLCAACDCASGSRHFDGATGSRRQARGASFAPWSAGQSRRNPYAVDGPGCRKGGR